MFIYLRQEVFSNFCDNVCAVWWIEPYYFLFRVFLDDVFCLMFCWYRILCIYPASDSASLYGLIEFLKETFTECCNI